MKGKYLTALDHIRSYNYDIVRVSKEGRSSDESCGVVWKTK